QFFGIWHYRSRHSFGKHSCVVPEFAYPKAEFGLLFFFFVEVAVVSGSFSFEAEIRFGSYPTEADFAPKQAIACFYMSYRSTSISRYSYSMCQCIFTTSGSASGIGDYFKSLHA